jgi:tRNA modification GTPase
MFEDTIVSISTALGKGAISIVRLSGEDAVNITKKIFRGKDLSKAKSHTITYGHIIDPETKIIIDEVLVSLFLAPKTFTKEDVVEINCHGGIFVTNKVLELTLIHGARMAEPGEFTKRAYLNGRIDLTQAEAVMDVIESQNDNALQLANQGLLGDVKRLIEHFRSEILSSIANIEVNIDYPEYEDAIVMTNQIIRPIVANQINQMNQILEKANTSRIIREGIKTAIIGRPNVGKSSLLNALLRENRAIVTEVEGTTRDTIEGSINLGGVVLNLIDTAGIRKTEDVVESIGVSRSKKAIEQAEIIFLVLDNSSPLNETDYELLELSKHKKRIIIVNKVDLKSKINLSTLPEHILISANKSEDIYQLENKIKQYTKVNEFNAADATYISNVRHITKLKEARKSLQDALASINQEMPVDIINIDLYAAWLSLGEIIGDTKSDSLLDELFTKFCLGK